MGLVSAEAVRQAEHLGRLELPHWRLAELLLHLGYVEAAPLVAAVQELVRDDVTRLAVGAISTTFRSGRARSDVAPPLDVAGLLAEMAARRAEWEPLVERLGGPDSQLLGRGGAGVGVTDDLLLAAVIEIRTLRDVAAQTGLTLLECARATLRLVDTGALDIEPVAGISPYAVPGADPAPAAEPALELESEAETEPAPQVEPAPPVERPSRVDDELADTAALMRELSALGQEDQPLSPAPYRPVPATADAPRKRGFFGR